MSLLVQTTMLATRAGQTTGLTVLVNGIADPVDTRVTTDRLVHGVHENDLEVLVQGVHVDPVAVQHTQIAAVTANATFGNVEQILLVLQLVHTGSLRLSVANTLGDGPFAATTPNTDTPDDESLLVLVSHTTRLVGASWPGHTEEIRGG